MICIIYDEFIFCLLLSASIDRIIGLIISRKKIDIEFFIFVKHINCAFDMNI